MLKQLRAILLPTLCAVLTALAAGPAAGQPFYEGKTLTVIEGRSPGGTGDLRVRAMVPFLQKYIPGNPSIVLEYMPGAGGRKVTNFIYNRARKDGLTIANSSVGTTVSGVVGAPGVQYELDKLNWLGSPYSTNFAVFVTWRESGLNTLEELRARSGIRIGGQSVGFITYIEARVFAYFLDLKDPVFVTGYSGAEMDLALQRGEIDARSNAGETALLRHPEWVQKNLVTFHAALESPKGYRIDDPAFANVPAITEFARSESERRLLDLARSFRYSGTPWIAPPGVPEDRLEILREAMRKTFKDPEFFASYNKLTGVDPTPITPEQQTEAIKQYAAGAKIVEVLKKIAGPGPLPPRMN